MHRIHNIKYTPLQKLLEIKKVFSSTQIDNLRNIVF